MSHLLGPEVALLGKTKSLLQVVELVSGTTAVCTHTGFVAPPVDLDVDFPVRDEKHKRTAGK